MNLGGSFPLLVVGNPHRQLTFMKQVILACTATLTPLYTYFRGKSPARHGYSDIIGNALEYSHCLNIMRSCPYICMKETNSDGWKDHDHSDDKSKQRITQLESSWLEIEWSGLGIGGRQLQEFRYISLRLCGWEPFRPADEMGRRGFISDWPFAKHSLFGLNCAPACHPKRY